MLNDRMVCVADLLDDGIESVNFVRCVVDDAFGAVWFDQRIRSLDFVAMTRLPRLLIVTGVQILYGVAEFIVGRCLQIHTIE